MIFKVPEGVYHFSGEGVQIFPEGVGSKCYFQLKPIEFVIFQVVRAPHTPLDPRMRMIDPLAISKFSSQQ